MNAATSTVSRWQASKGKLLNFYPYPTRTFVPADVLVHTQAGLEAAVMPQEKAACVLWLATLKSTMAVQHTFRGE